MKLYQLYNNKLLRSIIIRLKIWLVGTKFSQHIMQFTEKKKCVFWTLFIFSILLKFIIFTEFFYIQNFPRNDILWFFVTCLNLFKLKYRSCDIPLFIFLFWQLLCHPMKFIPPNSWRSGTLHQNQSIPQRSLKQRKRKCSLILVRKAIPNLRSHQLISNCSSNTRNSNLGKTNTKK